LDLAAADDSGSSSSDDITNRTSALTISGNGDSGALLSLYGSDQLLATTLVTSGSWSVDVNLAAGIHSLKAIQTDLAGNDSAFSTALLVTVDTVAPTATMTLDFSVTDDSGSSNSDRITNRTNSLSLSGSSRGDGDYIVLFNETEPLTTIAVVDGAWATAIDLTSGTYLIKASQTDKAGNSSTTSASLPLTIDTTVLAPTNMVLTPDDDSGFSATDLITSQTSDLTISGLGEMEAIVTLFDDLNDNGSIDQDELLSTVITDHTQWTAAIALLPGSHNIKAIQTDLAGNDSTASAAMTLIIDTVAPDAPTMDDSDTSIRSASFILNGNGATGSIVALFDETSQLLATTDVIDNSWSAEVTLADGTHVITAIQADLAGNQSTVSIPWTVVVDATAPAAPTALSFDPEDDQGFSNSDRVTNQSADLTLSGLGGDNSDTVILFRDIDSEPLATTTVIDGSWTVDLLLNSGTHTVRAVEMDPAGNRSPESTPLTLVVDTIILAPTGLDLAAEDDKGTSNSDHVTSQTSALTLSGVGESDAIVTLFDNNDQFLTTTVVSNNQWRTDVSLAIGTHNIKAKQTDVAGNVSVNSDALILVVIAQSNGVRYRLNRLTETTGSTVVGTAKADTVTLLSTGDTLTVSAIDTIMGTNGVDVIRLQGADTIKTSSVDTVLGSTGLDSVTLLSPGQLSISHIDNIVGTAKVDTVTLLNGGQASLKNIDSLVGSSGHDTIILASASKMAVIGVETVIGSSASDTISLSSTQEVILFNSSNKSNDTIHNFDIKSDLLVFSGLQTGSFVYLGSGNFTGGKRSEANFNTTSKLLQIDFNGDKKVDMKLTMPGVATLTSDHFSWSTTKKQASLARTLTTAMAETTPSSLPTYVANHNDPWPTSHSVTETWLTG
ncbi:MAG: hypothetical protein HQL58_13100, partial [Magnetococcales bacterium]|nr:hypothetical protein [Magnetococcales bacterium]